MTNRIKLINCDRALIAKILESDEALADYLKIKVPSKWSEFGSVIFKYTLEQITLNPEAQKWCAYIPILMTENILIGSCGYKGVPDDSGMVEIGYEVAEQYRKRGLATEMADMLIKKAFENGQVQKVWAHTLPHYNESTSVLIKNGFNKIDEIVDEEDGLIWRWEILK
jgi:RimJ/RimL family protein N-acetyltransferase